MKNIKDEIRLQHLNDFLDTLPSELELPVITNLDQINWTLLSRYIILPDWFKKEFADWIDWDEL